MEQTQYTQPQPQLQSQTPPPKKSPVKLIGLVGILILAMALIGGAIYFLLNQNGVQTDATETDGQVSITDRGIRPPTLQVKKGDSVVWTNEDKVPHRLVLSTQNPPAELEGFGGDEPINAGESYSFLFEVAGTFTYHDPEHPDVIQGTVVVE